MLNRFREFWTRVISPVARLLLRLRVSPDAVTIVGTLGVASGALFFFPRGQLLTGVLVITAFVFSDMVDGHMARLSGTSSSWGAFLDSTLDRLGDAAVFGGLVLYFMGPGESDLYAGLALYCLVMGAKGGLAERADRLVAILVMTGLSVIFGQAWFVPFTLAVLALASTVTVVQRILAVRRQALAAA